LSHYYPSVTNNNFRNVEAWMVMTTFSWLPRAGPDLKNWSGYDRLWIDVRCDAAPVDVWLAVEDHVLEPPVMRTYRVPPGRWGTLELDLKEAARARGLDLARISNFWLLGRAPSRTEMRVDNVRVARENASAPQNVLRDHSPMLASIKGPDRPQTPTIPREVTPERGAIELGKPITVGRGSMVPVGWVSAYDNRFLFVAYTADRSDFPLRTRAVYTDDGGITWKHLTDPFLTNLDHGSARGCAIDARGDGIVAGTGGCGNTPRHANPRQHLTKFTFTGSGWEARFPVILDSDARRCDTRVSMVRLSRGPYRGRLWACCGQLGRDYEFEVHAKFSDDDGRTWLPWGKGALVPDSRATGLLDKSGYSHYLYCSPQTAVTPYKDHVACFWRHKRNCGVVWSVYDGAGWSAPREVSPIAVDEIDPSYREAMSAVTRGDREIFFTATNLRAVLRWNGNSWNTEPVQLEDTGMLSLAGDTVTVFTSGKVKRPPWDKKVRFSRRTTLRYYRRHPDGSWEGPIQLTPEFSIDEYRSVAGYSVPAYSPPNFVPIAWSDCEEETVKLLRVPIR